MQVALEGEGLEPVAWWSAGASLFRSCQERGERKNKCGVLRMIGEGNPKTKRQDKRYDSLLRRRTPGINDMYIVKSTFFAEVLQIEGKKKITRFFFGSKIRVSACEACRFLNLSF